MQAHGRELQPHVRTCLHTICVYQISTFCVHLGTQKQKPPPRAAHVGDPSCWCPYSWLSTAQSCPSNKQMCACTHEHLRVKHVFSVLNTRNNTHTFMPAHVNIAAMSSNVPIKDAFKMADDVLRHGVRGISDIITVRGSGTQGQCKLN